jgi:polysaccharide transporter, PST family
LENRKQSVYRIAGFVFSIGGVRVGGILLSSLTFPYILRVLGVDGFGSWAYVLALVAFFELLSNPGISVYAQREFALLRGDAGTLIGQIFSIRLVLSIFVGVLLIAFALLVESNAILRSLILLYGVPTLLLSSLSCNNILVANEEFHWSSAQQFVGQASNTVLIFTFIHKPEDIYLLAGFAALTTLLSLMVGWIKLWRMGFRLKFTMEYPEWVKIIKRSISYGVASFMSQLYTRSGHLFVKWWLGETALGLYAAAVRFVELVFGFVGIIFGLLMPRLALLSLDIKRRRDLIFLGAGITSVISMPLAFGCFIMSAELIELIFGASFKAAAPLLELVSWYFLANSFSSYFCGTVLYALGRHDGYLRATAYGAFLGITLNIALIPLIGIHGACIAYVLAQIAIGLTAYLSTRDVVAGVWRQPFVGKSLCSSICMMLVLLFIKQFSLNVIAELLAGVFVYAACLLIIASKDVKSIFRAKLS